jgi:hypothetical protein
MSQEWYRLMVDGEDYGLVSERAARLYVEYTKQHYPGDKIVIEETDYVTIEELCSLRQLLDDVGVFSKFKLNKRDRT